MLSYMVETVKQLQKATIQTAGNHENLLVETLARVQGLTTDVTVFVIPQTVVYRSMETRLFNVATSRAKGYTIIITDKDIRQYRMSKEVCEYMKKLDEEFSFYLPFEKGRLQLSLET